MRRGDVVDVDWPFSDRTGSKVRPAVVVQADFLNGLIDDTLLVQVTSSRFGIPGTEVPLDPAVETASGLTRHCVANRTNVLTVEQAQAVRTVGFPSATAMREIERCLKAVLGLP